MRYKTLTGAAVALLMVGTSCSDFDEINKDPFAAGPEQAQMEYFINKSIIEAQQDPNIAERAFVLYWKDAAHMDLIGSLSEGATDDGWTGEYYNYVSGWLTNITSAIDLYAEKEALGTLSPYSNNLLQVARIWRAYLMSEFSDLFGSQPINGFQGVNPDFNSTQEVYTFMLTELEDAVAKMDDATVPSSSTDLDPAYGYDFSKWIKFANSLRMRFAMRIVNADPESARKHFEAAVSGGNYIREYEDNFSVQEAPGWNALAGVMSREWNDQFLSVTINNLSLGLGGIKTERLMSAFQKDIKAAEKVPPGFKVNIVDKDWMGIRYEDHFTTMTTDPSAGFWVDGLPHMIDPRAYKLFAIPGNVSNPHFNKYPSSSDVATTTKQPLLDPKNEKDTLVMLDATFTWNAFVGGDWDKKGVLNKAFYYTGMQPRLVNEYRNSSMRRVFFGSWESNFLIAEAAVYGWTVPLTAQEAYEQGIRESFGYLDKVFPGDYLISGYLDEYLASTEYNRCGTSVSWSHTEEPAATKQMRYKDGKTGEVKAYTYAYPANKLYKDGATRNDALTKIITQKFLAQVPWLPLEAWSDHRRLGLPFFETPAVENSITTLPALTKDNYKEMQWAFFPQRLPYPTALKANVPEGYKQAVELLGGADEIATPLFWSKAATR